MLKNYKFFIKNKYSIYNSKVLKAIVFAFFTIIQDILDSSNHIEISVFIKLVDTNKNKKEIHVLDFVLINGYGDVLPFLRTLKKRVHSFRNLSFYWRDIDYIVFYYKTKD